MATKNKAAAAAPEKVTAPLTAGQKAAATKAAKLAAVVAGTAAAAKAATDKVAAKKVKPAAPKAAPVEAVETEEVEGSAAVGRKQLADGIRTVMTEAGYGVSPNICLALVQAFEAAVENTLAAGTDVALPGFGKFKVTLRPGGPRRNPQNGTTIEVAPSWAASFKVGKALKDAVNTRPAE